MDRNIPFNIAVQQPDVESTNEENNSPADVFRSIGVEPLINCMGTYTIIGGSLERPAVRAAMEAASKAFVQYDELADGIGNRLAEVTGAPWGMVSAGCSAGLKHVTAACVSGGNPERLIRIPDLTGFERSEVVIPVSSRNVYDHAIRNIGVRIVSPHNMDELKKCLSKRTALIYLLGENNDATALSQVAELARPLGIPILVDAAADDLTVPNVYLKAGASVVAYSGGKALCGPQCAGLLLGDKDILMAAWQASSPHHGPGRDNKVGREEMIGMLAAVQAWITMDHAAEWKKWVGWLNNIARRLSSVNGVKTELEESQELSDHSPRLKISWDPSSFNLTGGALAEIVGRSKPRIALNGREGKGKDGMTGVVITASQMQAGEEPIVSNRLFEILSAHRQAPPAMHPPAAQIGGTWDMTIRFFSSTSQQRIILEQDGNWIRGLHIADLSNMEISGSLDGSDLKLVSNSHLPGDRLSYIFYGTVQGDEMSGSIHLGEYRSASFTGKRNLTKAPHDILTVPGGPPLAT